MTRIKSLITNGLLTLIMCLSIAASVMVVNSAQADASNQPVDPIVSEEVVYLQLQDAPPARDITLQRLAPLE